MLTLRYGSLNNFPHVQHISQGHKKFVRHGRELQQCQLETILGMSFTDVYGLTNLIKVPTRVVVESSSLTDVILTNKPRSVLTSGVFDLGLIDHNFIYTVMRLQCPKFIPRTVVKRHFKHYDLVRPGEVAV